VVICSFQFARSKEPYLRQTKWDLVVIDEAHRLRNAPFDSLQRIRSNDLGQKIISPDSTHQVWAFGTTTVVNFSRMLDSIVLEDKLERAPV
jgi:hypothetical protein